MLGKNKVFVLLTAAGLLAGALSCNGNALDDADSPNVVLSIQLFPQVPPVTTAYMPELQGCVYTLPAAIQVTLKNEPKNELASTGTWNAVSVNSAVIRYVWDDGLVIGPNIQSTAGLIPAKGTGSVSLLPILLGDVTEDRAGHSANMEITFRGKTVNGDYIESLPESPGGAVISVNSCVPTGGGR